MIALITVNIPLTQTPGTYTFELGGVLSASLGGDGVFTTTGVPFILGITSPTSPCDVDSSGSTDIVDVNLVKGYIFNGTVFDINNDGVTNIIDLQRVINAVNGVCRTN